MTQTQFNRIDIAQAHIAYGALYHSGQGSEAYRNMCRGQDILVRLHQAPFVEVGDLSENGTEIYVELGGELEE